VFVLRPLVEGGRYDLIFDIDGRLHRVQCKFASVRRDVVVIPARTCRSTPRGYVPTTYSPGEVDPRTVRRPGAVTWCRSRSSAAVATFTYG
jgi:PD-(D/E)XK endonuclease